MVLLQELIDKLIFQQYYNIVYLGQIIQCSIEFPGNVNPELNKIDMTSPDPNQRNITLNIKICTNYPLINTRTEIPSDSIITAYGVELDLYNHNYESDVIERGTIMNNKIDDYDEFIENISDKDKELTEIDNLEELIKKYDTNNDGTISEEDIEEILRQLKYGEGDDNDYMLKYSRLTDMINILNHQGNMEAEYDDFMKAIYITYKDSGEVKEIKLEKYKIQKDE